MESFIFNSFKERLVNGQVSGDDTWKLQPVNKKFVEDYEDNIKYVRNQTDLYYLNNNYSASGYDSIVENFSQYYTNIYPVQYTYYAMEDVDLATTPQFVTEENYADFIENNSVEKENNDNLKEMFFTPGHGFYTVDHYEEVIDGETGEKKKMPVARGFYYVKTKEDLKWCADKVNGQIYDNFINIVLGDNIGTNDGMIKLNFSIGEKADRPFEGVLYGNGYAFKNIKINCNKEINGIVGYLGLQGRIESIRIEGNVEVNCTKKISINHLTNGFNDVAVGVVCGKNNGRINKVVFNGNMSATNFYPQVYSVANKRDDITNNEESIGTNLFYPDYLCFDSLGNIVPYIGYFNEGVFATLSGYNKVEGQFNSYWRTDINSDEYKGFRTLVHPTHTDAYSPWEWYYWDGIQYEGRYVDSYNKEEDRKNILFYDGFIYAKMNELDGHKKFNPGISKLGLLPWNPRENDYIAPWEKGIIDIRKKRREINQYSLFENAPYFDKSIKMNAQNRAAYFVSPVVGINNSTLSNVIVQTNMVTNGTFVGFIGGLAGKQLNGNVNNALVNFYTKDLSSDSTVAVSTNSINLYHKRDYKEEVTETRSYYFPLQSIKNIGGLFGECIVVGNANSLTVESVTAFFENQHSKVITRRDGKTCIPEDYYMFDKFAGITPIIEYNTSNITDMWSTNESINNPINKNIKFKNLNITYNEKLSEEDRERESGLSVIGHYFKQIFNANGNTEASCWYPVGDADEGYATEAEDVYMTLDGAASPLICEIKPVYLAVPSLIETLYANAPKMNYSGYNDDDTYRGSNRSYSYNYKIADANVNASQVSAIGLYTMDQNLASPVSNPEFCGINLKADLPGISNPHMERRKPIVFDRFRSQEKTNFSLDIKDLMQKLINWERCKVSNNHDVWTHPDHVINKNTDHWTENNIFKYTVVPRAAKIPETFSVHSETDGHLYYAHNIDEVELGDTLNRGYNGNKIAYTYPYYGSDVKLSKNHNHYPDRIHNISGYKFILPNPHYHAGPITTDNDGEAILWDTTSAYEITVTNVPNNIYSGVYYGDALVTDGSGHIIKAPWPLYKNGVKSDQTVYIKDDIIEQMRCVEYYRNDGNFLEFSGLAADWSAQYRNYIDMNGMNDLQYFVRCGLEMDKDFQGKPLQNKLWTHVSFVTRDREDDPADLREAINVELVPTNIELLRKPIPNLKYITGYNVDEEGRILETLTSYEPPQLYSGYMKEYNYRDSRQPADEEPQHYHITPADERGWPAGMWRYAALTAVAAPPIKAYTTANYDYYADSDAPEYLCYKIHDQFNPLGDVSASAIWSAAIGYIHTPDGQSYSALLARVPGYYIKSSAISAQHVHLSKAAGARAFEYYRQGEEFEFIRPETEYEDIEYPVPWGQQTEHGSYKMDFLGCTWDASLLDDGLIIQEATAKPVLTQESVTLQIGSGRWFPAANLAMSYQDSNDDDYIDYFKYTYLKGIIPNNIGKRGILLPVSYNIANNKAGFWFNMGETEVSAYNDDIKYTSNVLAIGKTPNQDCILNSNLSRSEVSSVSFSAISADDFEGIYVTDSDNNPVMYINVGLGECSEGTSWTFSSYPSYKEVDKSKAVETIENGRKVYTIDDRIFTEEEFIALNATMSGLLLEVEA